MKAGQPQQVECFGPQCGHRPTAITSVAVNVCMELGVLDLLLTLKTTVISYLLQQCFWGGGQAGFAPRGAAIEALQMSGTEGYALPCIGGP